MSAAAHNGPDRSRRDRAVTAYTRLSGPQDSVAACLPAFAERVGPVFAEETRRAAGAAVGSITVSMTVSDQTALTAQLLDEIGRVARLSAFRAEVVLV